MKINPVGMSSVKRNLGNLKTVEKQLMTPIFVSNNEVLNKNTANILANNFMADKNMANGMSFGAEVASIEGAYLSIGEHYIDSGFHKFAPYTSAPPSIASDNSKYIESNPSSYLKFYVYGAIPSGYSYPLNSLREVSIIYIDKNCKLTRYNDPNKKANRETVDKGLIKDGRYEEFALLKQNQPEKIEYDTTPIIEDCIVDGYDDLAMEFFPDKTDYIKQRAQELNNKYNSGKLVSYSKEMVDILAEGNLLEAIEKFGVNNLPEPLNKAYESEIKEIAKIIDDNNLFEKLTKSYRIESFHEIPGSFRDSLDKTTDEFDLEALRVTAAMITIGITEIPFLIKRGIKSIDQFKLNNEKRNLMNSALQVMLSAKENVLQVNSQKTEEVKKREETKEQVKTILQKRLVAPLQCNKEDEIEFPNCVMLYGENPIVMKNLINWTMNQSDDFTNVVTVPNAAIKDDFRDNILDALEQAEENYQETNKRSIIFVNGMDRLLTKEDNSNSEIAFMKNLMSSANEDYHSTIMFYTKEPEELNQETLVSHRVGLKVEVPVEFEEGKGV